MTTPLSLAVSILFVLFSSTAWAFTADLAPRKHNPHHHNEATNEATSTAIVTRRATGFPGWSVEQAVSFVETHRGEKAQVGRQLRPLVSHWNGQEFGQLCACLAPYGVCDSRFFSDVASLLHASLPERVLEALELAACADAFLGNDGTVETFEKHSYTIEEYAGEFGRILGDIRADRADELSLKEVIQMLLHDESQADKYKNHGAFPSLGIDSIAGFLGGFQLEVQSEECESIVACLAHAGWDPNTIAELMSKDVFVPIHGAGNDLDTFEVPRY
jgi:hypothetical protein